MVELAVITAPLGQDIRTLHLWTQRNQTCDALSRLASGKAAPEVLKNAVRCPQPSLPFRILGELVVELYRTMKVSISPIASTAPALLFS